MSSEAPDAPEASTNGHEEGTEQVMTAESEQPEGESADAGEASEVLPEVSIAVDPDDSGGAGTAEHEDAEDGEPLPSGGGGGEGEGEGEPNFLPPFANEANRKLNRHIQGLDKQLEQTDGQLEESRDRISVMAEHLSNVQQELKFTQLRLEAKMKEISSEEHLKALSMREAGRIRSDIEKMGKERLELQDRMHGLQNQIFRTSEKMDGFKLLMNWNQEELEQWAVAQRQKEEDNLALEKYRRADEARIKELTMHLEKATQEGARAQEQVDLEVTETQAAQVQLDRTAAEFKQLHGERQQLIQQWDEAMDALRHRDRAIQQAVEAFAANKAALAAKQEALDSQAKFLDNEVQSNKDLDGRIALVDREVAKLRDTQAREVKRAEETADELELVRNELSKAANELAASGVQNGHSRQALDKKLLRLDAARKKHASLKRRLESEFGQLDTLEEKVKQLEGMRAAAERHLADAVKEVAVQKKEQYKSGQALFHSRERERELISEIAGGQAQARNLNHRIRYLDDQVVVQQELVYNVDFQLQQMERKVARARGERSDEETRALTALIDKLTKQLEGVNAEHQMLLNQVKKSEDDLSHAHRKHSTLKRDTGKLSETMSTLSLESDMVSRSVRAAVEQKEGQMVQHDCLKLEVKRLRQLLNTRADEVFSLENKKQQLQLSIQERQHEIQAHAQALKAELKMIRDDVHRVTLELKERQLKVHSLQSKHEVLSSRNKSVYAEEDAQQSQAYYIIKSAQEREELQQRGDRLDGLIRKAEKEVHALEQTLIKLTGQNTDFSKSFRRADQKDAFQQRVQLREELDRAYDRLKFKRQEERNITTDIDNLAGRLQQLEMEGESLEGLVGELERKRSEAMRLMEEQREKMGRAEAHLRRMQTELRARRGMPPGPALVPEATDGAAALLPEEKEVCLAQLRDMSRTMLQELRVLALENPGANIIEAVEAAGLKMPPSNAGPGSTRSRDSRDSSRAGSVISM